MTRLLTILLFILIIVLIISLFISCKDTQTGPSSEIIFPDDSVSYTKHVGPLFQQKCAHSPCHGGSVPAADLSLEYPSYSALINKPGLIFPGDADHSVLVQHLEGRLSPMPPPNFPQLTQNQIAGIRKWIDEGAEFN